MSNKKQQMLDQVRDNLRQALEILDVEGGNTAHPQVLRLAATQAQEANVGLNQLIGFIDCERQMVQPHNVKGN